MIMEKLKLKWKLAEKEGNLKYAKACKEKYREAVMESLKKPYKQFEERLKMFPMISLN